MTGKQFPISKKIQIQKPKIKCKTGPRRGKEIMAQIQKSVNTRGINLCRADRRSARLTRMTTNRRTNHWPTILPKIPNRKFLDKPCLPSWQDQLRAVLKIQTPSDIPRPWPRQINLFAPKKPADRQPRPARKKPRPPTTKKTATSQKKHHAAAARFFPKNIPPPKIIF